MFLCLIVVLQEFPLFLYIVTVTKHGFLPGNATLSQFRQPAKVPANRFAAGKNVQAHLRLSNHNRMIA